MKKTIIDRLFIGEISGHNRYKLGRWFWTQASAASDSSGFSKSNKPSWRIVLDASVDCFQNFLRISEDSWAVRRQLLPIFVFLPFFPYFNIVGPMPALFLLFSFLSAKFSSSPSLS
jgi:hypothetical protein